MARTAHLTSIDAIRDFRTALGEYEHDMREAVTQLLLELQRALDWVEHERATYWKGEVRRASDAVIQARQELERCEMAFRVEDRRSCHEQRLAFEQARQRLRLAEQKARLLRQWRVAVGQEADRVRSRLLKMLDFLDTGFPRALATLGRILAALEKYTESVEPGRRQSGVSGGGPGTTGSQADEGAAPAPERP